MPYGEITPIVPDENLLLLTDTFEVWKDKFNRALADISLSVSQIIDTVNRIPQPETVAERYHASTSEEYGLATAELYGHAKASNVVPSAPNTSGAIGTQTARFALADHAHPKQTDLKGNADTASKIQVPVTIDGVKFDGSENIIHYATCSTAAGTAAKTVILDGFTLTTGAVVHVKFNNTNTASNATLNVNSTGAKNIRMNNINVPPGIMQANCTYSFVYDGTYWQLTGGGSGSVATNGNTILNSNFNNLTTSGKYFITTTASTTNAPKAVAASWWVEVSTYTSGSTTYVLQEARMHSTSASSATSGPANVLVRCRQGSTWGPWTYSYAQFAG